VKIRTVAQDRSERLLALLLLQEAKGSSQREKTRLLSLAGFSNVEIADLLETTPAVVATNLYEARKTSGKKKSPSGTK